MFKTKFVQKIKTHILCSVTFFPENRAFYEIMWEHIIEWGKAQMAIWRMRIAWCIPKATITHSEYVILIAFPLQQWLRERASLLCYTYITCLALTLISILEPSVRRHYTVTALFCPSSLVL